MQPVEHLGPVPAQAVTAIDEQLQCDCGVVDGHLPQSGSPQGGHGDAVRVGRVGLTGLGGVEQPGSRGHFRRHVEHGLAVGDQALGDVPADAVAALDRPDPLLVLPTGLEHRLVAVAVSAEPALRKTFRGR